MSSQTQTPGHIEITETLVRLYVFLDAVSRSLPR